MARRTVPAKLPRSYFKRAKPSNIPKVDLGLPSHSDFILGGERTVATTGRQAFWANTFAKDLLAISRGTHMEATMGSWQHFIQQGHLDEEVAIIVDGSPSRPIKHVKFLGEIIIQEPANWALLFEAVRIAMIHWERAAMVHKKDGDYVNNIHVFMDNTVWVDPMMFTSPTGMERLATIAGETTAPPFFTLINTMPYAAKEERRTLPTGLAYGTWKYLRGAYGGELATRFRYYTSDLVDIGSFQNTPRAYKHRTATTGASRSSQTNARDRDRYSAGKLLSFPAINIGQPGAFASMASPVIIKAARKAK